MDHWYEIYVFTPSVLSCVCSVLLMVKFTIGSNQKFFFHQMSAILAFFDTVQCMGIFLDAPWLNKTCYPAAYLFMAGSLCKVLAIMYITSIITHAIFNLEAPSKDRKLLYSCLAISSGVISTVMMTMGGTAGGLLCTHSSSSSSLVNMAEMVFILLCLQKYCASIRTPSLSTTTTSLFSSGACSLCSTLCPSV